MVSPPRILSGPFKVRRIASAGLSLLLLITLIIVLSSRFGLVPPIGTDLNPFHGLWQRTVPVYETSLQRTGLRVPGLLAKVVIKVDRDQIKHVFAQNDHDLYFAQGYILASERLWEMEFLSRVAAGRLSEIFGKKTLETDRFFRKMGVAGAAEQSAVLMRDDPVTGPALEAYADGVNAFIATLTGNSLPLEYRFLGIRPEKWKASNAANLLKFMAWNLSGFSKDVSQTRSLLKVGKKSFAELFPLKINSAEPIVPVGTVWKFPTRNPKKPTDLFEPSGERLEIPMPDPSNGSNSWAVTGKKSTTGLPILSNDVHLNYSLPALWYEMQLVSPNQNVYGVTIPGAPGIVLGFNKKIAWGVTNGGTDVQDWFELRFRDEKKSEYLFDGGWRPVISRETEIKVRGAEPDRLLLRDTHFGPIVYDEGETPLFSMMASGLAMRWTALLPSNELKSFLLLNKASSVDDCRMAIDTFSSPAQNFLCVDNKGDTGLWHMGRFPVRWEGQGRIVGDGSDKTYDWHGWIPPDEVPMVKNPARGFLSSANQWPADENYPHYLGAQFEPPFRALRIDQLLKAKQKFSPGDFIAMQSDTVAPSMQMILPLLMNSVVKTELNSDDQVALASLRNWDYSFSENSVPASIAVSWVHAFERNLWAPYFGDGIAAAYPPLLETVALLKGDPQSRWFDNPHTEEKENLGNLAVRSLKEAMHELRASTNRSNITRWTWGSVRPTHFDHIGKLPGLGDHGIAAGGFEYSIFANKASHGPVWKLVVAVGAKPKAWSIYPGGQSGDPMSPHYDEFIDDWKSGHLKEVNYLMSDTDENTRQKMELVLENQKGTK